MTATITPPPMPPINHCGTCGIGATFRVPDIAARDAQWLDIVRDAVAAAERERDDAILERDICREAIEVAHDVVQQYMPTDTDSESAVYRCTIRRLNEAVGKAAPRLLMERAEGQELYGLHYRRMKEERDAAIEGVRAAVAAERERIAQMFDVPPAIHGETEDLFREVAAEIRATKEDA